VKYILDAHAYLWHALNDPKLPSQVRAAVDDPVNEVAVSIASVWEIGIKISIGKLVLPVNIMGLYALAQSQSIEIIPISPEAVHHTSTLDWFNKDPFDRLIAATTIIRGETLVTIEEPFERWGVSRFW